MYFKKQEIPLKRTNGVILTLFPNKPCFLRVCSIKMLKTLREKEKLLENEQFFLFCTVFSTGLKNFLLFPSNCCLQTLSVRKRFKIDYCSTAYINATRVQLTIAALVNSVFIKCASKYGGRGPTSF